MANFLNQIEQLSIDDFIAKFSNPNDLSNIINSIYNDFLRRGVAPYYSVDRNYGVDKPRFASIKHVFNAYAMHPLMQLFQKLDINEMQLSDGTWLNLRNSGKSVSFTVTFTKYIPVK